MKKSTAMKKFFDAVFQCCRKTKVAKDSRSSLGTKILDQNLDHRPDKLWPTNGENMSSYDFRDGFPDSSYVRRPHTGSNISKPPTLSEIPKIINPAAWVSSKTQEDTKPIKN